MAISVTPVIIGDKKGWLVTKDGQTYTITDTNGDGIFNKGDLIDCAEGAEALSAEDIFNVSYKVQLKENGGKGVSAEDMARFAEYEKAAEERDAAQHDYDIAQRKAKLAERQAAKPKKKSFIEKVMPWLNLTTQAATTGAMVYGAIKGDFWGLGMFGSNWAYNSTSIADMAGLNFTNLANSAMWTSQLNNNSSLYSSLGLDLSSITGGAAGAVSPEKTALTAAQNNVNKIIENAGTASEAETAAEDAEIKTTLSGYGALKSKDETTLPYVNNEAYDDLKAFDKDTYTEEDKKTIAKLKKYPHVPHTAISDEEGDGKLTAKQAEKIEAEIKTYLASNKNHGETLKKVYDELSKESIDIDKVKALLKELNGVTEDDI